MPTQKKIEMVEELRQLIERASITISADYRGLRVQEMQQMRRRLREANVDVRVVKNNLLRLAADRAEMAEIMLIVEGSPAALVTGYDDIAEAARAVTEYAQSAPPTFAIRGAYMDGRVVSAEDLKELVRLPPKPVLLSMVAGSLQSPLATFAGLLEAPLRELSLLLQSAVSELPGLLEARARQLEASGEQPAPVAEPPEQAAAEPEAGAEAAQPETEAAQEESPAEAEEQPEEPEQQPEDEQPEEETKEE